VLDTKSPKYLEMAQGHISLSLIGMDTLLILLSLRPGYHSKTRRSRSREGSFIESHKAWQSESDTKRCVWKEAMFRH
jgi:hypothetical protein